MALNKQFIKKAFKYVDKEDSTNNITMACDLIRAYAEGRGIDITTDYMQFGLGWNLQQQIINRRGRETIQSLSIDYVLAQVESIRFQMA